MFNFDFSFFSILVLNIHWEIKELSEADQEYTKQEITIYLSLHMTRKLLNQLLVFFGADSLVLIVDPSVVEVLLDLVLVLD